MKDPAYTWNAVVVGEDTPCWSGTRRHEHLKACAAHAAARCCRHDSFANRPTSQGQRTACRSREPLSPTTISGCGTKIGAEHSLSWHRFPWIGSGADDRTELPRRLRQLADEARVLLGPSVTERQGTGQLGGSVGGFCSWPRAEADQPAAGRGWPHTPGWVGNAGLGAQAVAK
jgi:hypothetical protein